jgi:hypothetical protein
MSDGFCLSESVLDSKRGYSQSVPNAYRENDVPDFFKDAAVSFKKKGEFVTRSIAGETIVVPVRGQIGDLNAIYNLNEVGAFIWEQMDGRKSVTQVVEAVRGEFDVALEQADKETSEFIAALEAAGMIESSDPKA